MADNEATTVTDEPQAEGARTASKAFRDSARHIQELKEYAGYFVAAKLDGLKLSARAVVLRAILAAIGAIATASIVVTSVVLLLLGLAHGLGKLLNGMDWLGEIIVGLVMLGAFAAISISSRIATRQRTVNKYESRLHQEHDALGHDVAERAARAGRVAN